MPANHNPNKGGDAQAKGWRRKNLSAMRNGTINILGEVIVKSLILAACGSLEAQEMANMVLEIVAPDCEARIAFYEAELAKLEGD